ncbi:MAG: hypothetical protein QXR17_08855 [Candidatus Bathyarchaeia archaeon]
MNSDNKDIESLLRENLRKQEKLFEEVVREQKEILHAQKEIISSLKELNSNISMLMLLQMCRDNERDFAMAKEYSNIIKRYLDDTNRTLQEVVKSFAKELKEIDDELDKNLTGVFAVILDFVEMVRKIKGVDSKSKEKTHEITGITKIEVLRDYLYDLLKKLVESRSNRVENYFNEIKKTVQDIRNEVDTLIKMLFDYSVENIIGRTAIVGVPVIKISLESKESYAVLGGELSKYESKILDNVKAMKTYFKLNYDILAEALRVIKYRGGFLFRVFLNHVVKAGEVL